jgi:hypothetical protein
MSHSANPTQYHPRYHKPEPQEAHLESINAQDKFDQAVKFLVMAREMDAEEAAEMVKAEGAEKFLAERDAPAPEPEEA